MNKNTNVGNHFNLKIKEVNHEEDIDIPPTNYFIQKDIGASGKRVQNSMYELHRKSVASAYYNYLVKLELNERNINNIFGPFHTDDGNTFTFKDSVDDIRSKESYDHKICAGKFYFCLILVFSIRLRLQRMTEVFIQKIGVEKYGSFF